MGEGSAIPVVSMRMQSNVSRRSTKFNRALTRSPRTVQHTHPLSIVTISSAWKIHGHTSSNGTVQYFDQAGTGNMMENDVSSSTAHHTFVSSGSEWAWIWPIPLRSVHETGLKCKNESAYQANDICMRHSTADGANSRVSQHEVAVESYAFANSDKKSRCILTHLAYVLLHKLGVDTDSSVLVLYHHYLHFTL